MLNKLKKQAKEIEVKFKNFGEMNVDDNTKRKYFELLCEINELEYVDSIKEDIKRLKELQDICFTVTFGSEYVKVDDVLKQYLIFGKENKKFSGETEMILDKLFKYFSENIIIIEYYKSFPTTPDLYEILDKIAEMI